MASLTLGGVNLDVQGLVSQLMEVESTPLVKLQVKASEYESQLSAFGRLKSAMSAFQSSMKNLSSPDKFEIYKVSTTEAASDQSFTANVDSNANPGNFSVEVLNLAEAHKLGSTSFFSSTSASVTDSPEADNPSGNDKEYLNISVGSDALEQIDIKGKSLAEIRDDINTAASTQNIGVSASIVKQNDNEYHLVLSSTKTGTDNNLTLSGLALDHLNGLSSDHDNKAKKSEIQEAVNAQIEVDGYTITSASNTIENVISGVSLNLLKESTAAADLVILRDNDAAKEAVSSFVSGFNTMLSTINALKESGLEGDSMLNSILSSVRSEFNSGAGLNTSFNYLSEIGILSNAKTGELELDSAKLDKAISADYNGIAQLFANDNQGIAFRLEEKMDNYISFDGLIKTREDGLRNRIDYNETSQANMEYRLEQIEARYLKQFSALDSIISQSNATSSYLTQQLANLPSFYK